MLERIADAFPLPDFAPERHVEVAAPSLSLTIYRTPSRSPRRTSRRTSLPTKADDRFLSATSAIVLSATEWACRLSCKGGCAHFHLQCALNRPSNGSPRTPPFGCPTTVCVPVDSARGDLIGSGGSAAICVALALSSNAGCRLRT
jgi:hypothetical protein